MILPTKGIDRELILNAQSSDQREPNTDKFTSNDNYKSDKFTSNDNDKSDGSVGFLQVFFVLSVRSDESHHKSRSRLRTALLCEVRS